MKRGVFFCDIMGTLTNDLNGNDINEIQVESLIRHLEKIKKADNLDEMYFSLISSDHMEDIVNFFNKKIRAVIEKSTIKIGPAFSSTHFKEMGEYEEPTDYKGKKCQTGKPTQIYQAIINEIKLKKQFELSDIEKIYFADDAPVYHEFISMFINKKVPGLKLQNFILVRNKSELENSNHLNEPYITEGSGINSLNALLGKYIKDKTIVNKEKDERV